MAHVRLGAPKTPKKAAQVKGDKMKVKKINELKKVTKQLDKMFGVDKPIKRSAKEIKIDKLFDKKQKLREQLGID